MYKLTLKAWLLFAVLINNTVLAETEIEKRLGDRIKQALGGEVVINSVAKTPLTNLYEVIFDNGKVIYISEDGRYVLEGDLMDLDERENLTENRRIESRAQALANVDVDTLIEYAPQDTQHVLYVYTDIDCGYCQKFHDQIKTLNDNGIAIRYLAFPRAGLNSSAYVEAQSAWCAKDKKAALTAAKAGHDIEPAVCDDRVKDQFELGQAMGVRGTPSVFLASGREMGGYIPADELIRYFQGGL